MSGWHRITRLPAEDWQNCREPACEGIALPEADNACLLHADQPGRVRALQRMYDTRVYDVRGTTLTADDFMYIARHRQHRNRDGGVVRYRDHAQVPKTRYDFRHCIFTEQVHLRGTHLPRGHVDFAHATFELGANFSEASILAAVLVERTQFEGPATFEKTTFSAPVWFIDTQFNDAGADFTEASFASSTIFQRVRSSGQLIFSGATFSARTDFERVAVFKSSGQGWSVDLSDTVFDRRVVADFDANVLCDGARFEDGLELRLSGACIASFCGVRLGAASTVAGVHRLDLDAGRPVLRPTPTWLVLHAGERFRPPLLLSLQDTDVEKLSLADVDLGHCLFAGAHNLDKLRLDGPVRFARLPSRGFRTAWNWPVVWRWSRRDVIREEYLWRMGRIGRDNVRFRYWAEQFALPNTGPQASSGRRIELITGERLASLYRSLRKAREDAKDEPGAGDFYYGEQEARRGSRSTPGHERWLLAAYWALSGYGQRARRALLALGALLAILAVLLTGYGLADSAPVQRITDAAPMSALPPQVITIDITGPRMTATIPPTARPTALDVTVTPPTLPPPGQRWTAARAQRAIRTLLTSLVPISSDQRLTATGAYLLLIGRVLGAFLLGLAVLAVRARVKR